MKKGSFPGFPSYFFPIMVSVIILIVGLMVFTSSPMVVKGILAKPTEFSAKLAQKTIKDLSELGPKVLIPSSTKENKSHQQAREYVQERMKELGLSPQIQTEKVCYESKTTGIQHCSIVHNLLGKIVGDPTKPALLLAAHYDSAYSSPGAADDGAGIATILEIVRILKLGKSPLHPVMILITDGEEWGMLGAKAFVRSHPWAEQVGIVLNFEARGTQGQTAMFEVSEGNQWLIQLYSKQTNRPASSSTIATLYQLLPNSTDMKIFLSAGMQGLNFAFADGEWNYHTERDDIAHLDLRSVQDMGEQGLALAKSLSQLSIYPKATNQANSVWFDLFTLTLVSYSVPFAQTLSILQAFLALFLLGKAFFQHRIPAFLMFRYSLQIILGFLAGAGFLFLITLLLQNVRKTIPGFSLSLIPIYIWLALITIIGTYGMVFFWNRGTQNIYTKLGAVLFVETLLSVGNSFLLPGISYLFTWPALFSSIGLFLFLRKKSSIWISWLSLHLGFFIAALLLIPLVRILIVMGGYHLPSIGLLPLLFLAPFLSYIHQAITKPILILLIFLELSSIALILMLPFWS